MPYLPCVPNGHSLGRVHRMVSLQWTRRRRPRPGRPANGQAGQAKGRLPARVRGRPSCVMMRDMREHRYSFDMPHSAARIWAIFQDYDRWTDYAPMVRRVDVLYPGDRDHNGRLRRVIYKMPFGREGSALELVTDVEPERGYTYTMISAGPGNDQIGHVRLEPLASNRTRFHFDETYNLTSWPWRWFEGPIYRFINKNNEDSMRRASQWLSDHPDYRADLVDS
jgi:hypothetical protein